MKTIAFAFASLAVLSAAGCGPSLPANAPSHLAPAQTSPSLNDAVVAEMGHASGKSIAIAIAAPQDAGYKTQAIIHKWVDADVFEYRATLKVWDGQAYVDLASPLTITVPRKGDSPKTKAVFANLKQGLKYEVSLVAMGDNGGTAATTTLNSVVPTAEFDFTAIQDVEDTLSATMQIVFDAVPFSGSGSATVSTPEDGTFANPTEAETGSAE